MKNVFILCTGRCGSTTMIKACQHITNFTASHESRSGKLGDERMNYPENHIEADNRLAWLLGRLDRVYGDNAFYCHLTRDETLTATSFTKRFDRGIIKSYRSPGILMGLPPDADPFEVSLDYCVTVNENIRHFLKNKSNQMNFRLENYQTDFLKFWESIGAEGDYDAAIKEFEIKHNAS